MTREAESLASLERLKSGLDGQGPAAWLSDEQAQALVERALSAQPSKALPLAGPRGASRRALPKLLRALALAILGASAALALERAVRSSAPATSSSSVLGPRAPLPDRVAKPPPVSPEQLERSVVQAPATASAGNASLDEGAATRGGARAPSAEDADLLKRANDLRRKGDAAGAESLYRVVISRYPSTMSAYVARLSVASLIVQRNPSGAVELYRAAARARPSGPLDLEIRQGLARAHRQLGDHRAESRELTELASRYPETAAAERARARLAELLGPAQR